MMSTFASYPGSTIESMAGYSGTPLAKKLGIGERAKVFVSRSPVPYDKLVAPLPNGVKVVTRGADVDVIHLFETEVASLGKNLEKWRHQMRPDAALWVSWPKKSSGVKTDITEDMIRTVALPMGLVDVKVCAVDETWSGLKLVIRKELR